MRSISRILALGLLSAGLAFAQSKFSERLTLDERRAAGLDQLSEAQVAALDALVARDARGAVSASKMAPAANAPAAKSKMDAPAAAAEPARAPAEKKTRAFGLPAKEDVSAITGTLVGEYRGWNGSTIFRLEDGQMWVQADRTDVREIAPRQNVRVKIEKSMFGGFKLTAEGDPMWVRVRRVQ